MGSKVQSLMPLRLGTKESQEGIGLFLILIVSTRIAWTSKDNHRATSKPLNQLKMIKKPTRGIGFFSSTLRCYFARNCKLTLVHYRIIHPRYHCLDARASPIELDKSFQVTKSCSSTCACRRLQQQRAA
jgi:hypothetical protein